VHLPHLKTFIYDYHIYEGCTAAKKGELQKPDFKTVFGIFNFESNSIFESKLGWISLQ